jgi:putative glutamine transport system permease protein
MGQALSDVFTLANARYLFSGLLTTVQLSVATVLSSLLFGSVLALLRNYEKRFFGRLAAAYIEFFRNTPLLLWMLVCIFMVHNGTSLFRGGLALVLYTSSVVAEIVRGGLNSIQYGQLEAARSQGFSFLQTLAYIILPQCYLRIIPSLMSQVITTVKDTSFLAQFAIAEFFYRSKIVLVGVSQKAPITSAHVFAVYGFVALCYFLINFTLSVLARRLRARLESA